jgi:hypothetical protein
LVGFCLGLGRVRPVFVFDEHLPAEFGWNQHEDSPTLIFQTGSRLSDLSE